MPPPPAHARRSTTPLPRLARLKSTTASQARACFHTLTPPPALTDQSLPHPCPPLCMCAYRQGQAAQLGRLCSINSLVVGVRTNAFWFSAAGQRNWRGCGESRNTQQRESRGLRGTQGRTGHGGTRNVNNMRRGHTALTRPSARPPNLQNYRERLPPGCLPGGKKDAAAHAQNSSYSLALISSLSSSGLDSFTLTIQPSP